MSSRWVKLNASWMESEWLIVLSAEARLAWVQLLCYTKTHGLAGRVKVKPTAVFARQSYLGEESVEQMIRAAKADGALEESDGDWLITGWGKHQGDETAAERMRRLRAKKEREDAESADAQVQTGPNVTGVTRNKANVTVEEKRGEEKRDIPTCSPSLRKGRQTGSKFKKPTAEEVAGYAKEIELPMSEARGFFDYQESKGWVVGRVSMKDWRASLRTWKGNWLKGMGNTGTSTGYTGPKLRKEVRD